MSAPKVVFYEALKTLLDAGLNINLALNHLSTIKAHARTSHLLTILIQNGHSLSKALQLCGAKMDIIQCIETGEQTGNLAESLSLAITLQTFKQKLIQEATSVLRYPVALSLLCAAVLIFLNIFMLPNFEKMFRAQHKSLPMLTELVFSHAWASFMILGIILCVVTALFWPLLKLHKNILFCLNIGTKLSAGIHLSNCLNGNLLDLIERGYPISIALKVNQYPNLLTQIITLGEIAGTLDKSFLQAANLYQTKLNTYLTKLKSTLPGILLMIMSALVGLIVVALYLPLLTISGS